MNDVKINKNEKINFLYSLKELTDKEKFCKLHIIIFFTLHIIIFYYISYSIKLYQLIPNDMLKFLFNIMLFSFYVFLINFIKKITSKLIKREYIKINSEIKYLQYVPEECFDNIDYYIERNKKDLEIKYEEELLKKQISNF